MSEAEDRLMELEARLDTFEFAEQQSEDADVGAEQDIVPDDTFRFTSRYDIFDVTDNDYKIVVATNDPNWAYDGACSGPNYGVSAVTLGTFFSDPYREITYVNVSGVTASHYFYIKIEGGTNGLDVLEVLTSSSQIYNGDSVTTDHDEYMYVPVMYIHYENSRIDLRKSLDLRDFVHAGYAFAFGGSDVYGSDIIAGYGARIGGTSAGSLVDGETVIDGGLITSLT